MAAATSPIVPELPIIRARGEGEQRATFFELLRPRLSGTTAILVPKSTYVPAYPRAYRRAS